MRNIFVLMLLLSMTTVPLLGMDSEKKNYGLFNCVRDFCEGYRSTMNKNNSIFDDQDTNSQRLGKALAETIFYCYYKGGVGVISKDVPKFIAQNEDCDEISSLKNFLVACYNAAYRSSDEIFGAPPDDATDGNSRKGARS